MSSRRSHRLVVTALALAVLLALAAPPAQASQRSSLLDTLGAKVQTWLSAWLPGWAGSDGRGMIAPKGSVNRGGDVPKAGATPGGADGRKAGRAPRGGRIRVECSGQSNPDGCPG
jgi:hypothetical protein